ncbi:hypothetical protein [Thermomonas alba]|uniref:hypothetical protein n=1 Tax=Thermomonas alba TaxID=2888525 RepID=UPI001F0423EE|nr:hypothetical protein [Thermomonas alba]
MNAHADRSVLTPVAGAALGLGLLFMTQAYFGIDHDSVLYLGEALRLRLPDILDHDLFFAHGSQGRYTAFPHLVAALLAAGADASQLFMAGTILGLLLFAATSWLALRALLPPGQRWLPWLALLCLPTAYGAYRIFGYGEPFFTPRGYAESLCLLALALLTRQRLRTAAACLLAAGLLHPLQALGAALVFWLWLALADRRWLHALWLAPIPFVLGLAGIAPFDGLLHPLDAATYKLAYQFSRHLFVGGWRAEDFQTLAFDLLVLLHVARTQPPPLRRWSLAAAIAMPLALATSYVLADVLRLALPAGLQLWRAHWLAHWLAMASVGALIQRDLSARDTPRLLLLALVVTLAYGRPGWAWMPFGLLYVFWPHLQPRLRPALQRLVGAGCLLAVLLFFLDYIAGVHAEFVKAHRQLAQVPFDRAFFTFPALTLTLALAGSALWQRAARAGRLVLLGLLLPFCAYAGLRWDARPALYKALEAHPFRPGLFGVPLPEHAQVYWERASSVANWLVINRADYYSPQQLSGLVFSPGAAADARARMDRLRPLRQDVQKCLDAPATSAVPEAKAPCRISSAALRAVCAPGTSAAPAPDYLILPYRQSPPALGQWTVRLGLAEEPTRTYYLYDCRDLR